jgi:hypothetical protein
MTTGTLERSNVKVTAEEKLQQSKQSYQPEGDSLNVANIPKQEKAPEIKKLPTRPHGLIQGH